MLNYDGSVALSIFFFVFESFLRAGVSSYSLKSRGGLQMLNEMRF